MDVTCGMTNEQFSGVLRLLKGRNLPSGNAMLVELLRQRASINAMAVRLGAPVQTVLKRIASLYMSAGVPEPAVKFGLGFEIKTVPQWVQNARAGDYQAMLA